MSFRRTAPLIVAFTLAAVLVPRSGSAACMNKFVSRPDGNKQVITLLTGKYTFDEAKALAAAINAGSSPQVEWLNDAGRAVARQFGAMKVVRPMPVGCDGKASGVVVVVTFISPNTPHAKLQLKLDANTTVQFDEQSD